MREKDKGREINVNRVRDIKGRMNNGQQVNQQLVPFCGPIMFRRESAWNKRTENS